ncbi:MAG: ATP-dependent DNA ligase [Anaerolineae bacterium]|nr:ATP-dependent DNA ligase [Anaerolineae bacterium]
MPATPLADLARLLSRVEQTSKRLELASLLADFLERLDPEEVPAAVRLVVGQVFAEWDERALNVSWQTVSDVVNSLVAATPADQEAIYAQAVDGGQAIQLLLERARRSPPIPPPLTLQEVYQTFQQIAAASGSGSRSQKEGLLRGLLQRAGPAEAKTIVKNVLGEMRHGAGEGMMLEGIARAAGIPAAVVMRANQLWGDLGEVAYVALTQGEAALRAASIKLFRPLKPMLAAAAEEMSEAFARHEGQLALEYKLDGARVQIHADGSQVRIYSRQLQDVTASLPDVAAMVRQGMQAKSAVLDGEAVAVDAEGRPLPFQDLMRRFRRVRDIAAMVAEIPLRLYLFDLLYLDGRSLIDEPYTARWQALERAAGHGSPDRPAGLSLVRRSLPATVEEGLAFAQQAHQAGHEGVMAKQLDSRYTPGMRGKGWLKLKHVFSLDLVIVAAEWGYGRRHGWLSNYHLAARDPATGDLEVIGKTFKGLTDAEFEAMTRRLLALEVSRKRSVVYVQPKVVVEVLVGEVQKSPRYRSGLALRFARIVRIRDDKPAREADTLDTVRKLFEDQFRYKGRRT